MIRPFRIALATTVLLTALDTVHADHGCPLDHFAIGQLQGEGSHTGPLFADVTELYTTHTDGTKDFPAYYPLEYSAYYDAYRNGEPGTEEIEFDDDPEHALADTRLIHFDIWLEIVDISTNGLWVGAGGEWYNTPGGRFHPSAEEWHHLHMTYHVYADDWSAEELFYVVYRVVDDLEDGQQYDPSEDFWVILNREIPGDFNKNGHIDLYDYAHFQAAFTGPDIPQTDPDYQDADLDGDDDVDLDDYARFAPCLGGPAAYADPRCTG